MTGFPECLDGRVKTLHPAIHGGLLADRRMPDHVQQLGDLGIEPFDLVVVNLYPFVETVASGAAPDDVVEQIDIGGPAMVRAAAKNHPSVAVVVDPAGYPRGVDAVAAGGFTLASGGAGREGVSRTPPPTTSQVAAWMGDRFRPPTQRAAESRTGRARPGSADGAAVRREPAPAGRAVPDGGPAGPRAGETAARQGDELQQLRRRRRRVAGRDDFDRAGGGHHQARQPVRHRRRRATSPRRTARPTPATRSPRSAV